MIPAEFLDNHGFAVVRRTDDQQVGHALSYRQAQEVFKDRQSLVRSGIANPTLGPKPSGPLRLTLIEHCTRRRVQMADNLTHHNSISSKGRARGAGGGSVGSGTTSAGVAGDHADLACQP